MRQGLEQVGQQPLGGGHITREQGVHREVVVEKPGRRGIVHRVVKGQGVFGLLLGEVHDHRVLLERAAHRHVGGDEVEPVPLIVVSRLVDVDEEGGYLQDPREPQVEVRVGHAVPLARYERLIGRQGPVRLIVKSATVDVPMVRLLPPIPFYASNMQRFASDESQASHRQGPFSPGG